MAKARRKSAPREIRDIRFPTSHIPERPAPLAEIPVRKVRPVFLEGYTKPTVRRRRFPWKPLAVFALLALVAAIAGGVLWYRQKATEASYIQEVLKQANLPVPDPELPGSLGEWFAALKDIFSDYGDVPKASLEAIGALSHAAGLLEGIPAKFLAKDGTGVAADLATLRADLEIISVFLREVAAKGSDAAIFPGLSEYAEYAPDVERARLAADRLLVLLQAPGEHHVLVLFGNSAELRPGGGFLGSFADITFGSSTIGDVIIHDINEVDRGLEADIVPPKPMQSIVTRWRAADANWFFNYPESARKVLEMMGRSTFYASSTLDGAILISPKIIQDLLAAAGPIELENGVTVTAETVIPMIQREVQAGQASGSENPKEILAQLLPPLQSKLLGLDDAGSQKLVAAAKEWIGNKDLAIFLRDPELMKIASYYEADGASYVIPQDFSGDYLAAVNANLGGGKSDAMINDTIDFESDLRADGVIENQVAVIRESGATREDEWWYRVTNLDYLQVFTPQGAALTAASGGRARTITARANYSKGFETDPDVAAIEATLKPVQGFPAVAQFRESGKNVFATWLTTPAGGSSTARFQYRRGLKAPFRDGDAYTFVYERQSGAKQSLHIVLNAPPGFVWEAGGVSRYEYFSEAAPGRVVLALTLVEI